jgi:hypothetical protein
MRPCVSQEDKAVAFSDILVCTYWGGGKRWSSWLRHSATRRKLVGSIPDGVIGIFHLRPHHGSGTNSVSNVNEYHESSVGVQGLGA